jgi:hypothetical protein
MFGSVGHVGSRRQIAAGAMQPVMVAVTGLMVLLAMVMSRSAQADTVVQAGVSSSPPPVIRPRRSPMAARSYPPG